MLTMNEIQQIQLLQIICEHHDDISLKLNWDMLNHRKEAEKSDFFHYHDGVLVGFAAVYGFGNEAEICGMVHPDYRRNGIFSALLADALPILEPYQKILLNAPGNSITAKSFIKAKGYDYSFSEHQMKWSQKELIQNNTNVKLRHAKSADLKKMSELDHLCFGIPLEHALDTNNKALTNDDQTNYIISYLHKDVGKIRVQDDGTENWIYAFAIHPSFQGKGIGKAALTSCLVSLNKKGAESIHLDVVATNNTALKLYESCGFKVYGVQDYYQYTK
ncbi:GNAT family N-acetyltransferase [Cytobacillus gottheilii]|uniref:GNAT family N-acetyltransferase n=1 Tax=Cytobacillus gottheilii TaxID=859144 RepID=UPI0009B99250|nr:GNAT family N-acetyltransferase [Cytobacillus gottheilii]